MTSCESRGTGGPSTEDPNTEDPGASDCPIVSLQSASFGYGERTVVSGVTLDVHGGEVVALLGPNGSGKSTLVKGLLGLNEHVGGDVALFGTPIAGFRDHARLGYVPQRHTLSASVRATVTEIVAIGRLPHQSFLARLSRQDRVIIAEALELVGLADRAQEDVSTLSGGQQRRVLIARALAARPDVLIMDEPTAGVDAASQQVLADVLARLASRGTTMLIVTHELAALRGIISRILLLGTGHVRFDGSPEAFAREEAAYAMSHDGHHHDDEDLHRGAARAPATPTAGPFDRRDGGHRA